MGTVTVIRKLTLGGKKEDGLYFREKANIYFTMEQPFLNQLLGHEKENCLGRI